MEWSLDPNDLGSDFGSQSMLTDENNGKMSIVDRHI